MKTHSLLWIILLATFACGGGGDQTSNFFDLVPSETAPNSAWNGDWSWGETVSSTTCPGLEQGSTSHWTGHIDLTSDTDCEKLVSQDTNLPNTVTEDFRCEWGDKALAIQWKLKTTSDTVSTCTVTSTINEILEINELDSNKIEGTITADLLISKSCPVESGAPLTCNVVTAITGDRTNLPSSSLYRSEESENRTLFIPFNPAIILK